MRANIHASRSKQARKRAPKQATLETALLAFDRADDEVAKYVKRTFKSVGIQWEDIEDWYVVGTSARGQASKDDQYGIIVATRTVITEEQKAFLNKWHPTVAFMFQVGTG